MSLAWPMSRWTSDAVIIRLLIFCLPFAFFFFLFLLQTFPLPSTKSFPIRTAVIAPPFSLFLALIILAHPLLSLPHPTVLPLFACPSSCIDRLSPSFPTPYSFCYLCFAIILPLPLLSLLPFVKPTYTRWGRSVGEGREEEEEEGDEPEFGGKLGTEALVFFFPFQNCIQ